MTGGQPTEFAGSSRYVRMPVAAVAFVLVVAVVAVILSFALLGRSYYGE